MAATLSEIEFDYQKAIAQAGELESIAQSLKKVGNDTLESSLNTIKGNWEGENSKAYCTKGNKLKIKIVKTAGDIEKAASTLRTIAKNVYDAEKRNIQIAMEREAKAVSGK